LCPVDVLGRLHHPLENPAVNPAVVGGAVAVPGGDTARQDALNGASVRVLGAKPNLFSLLRLKVHHTVWEGVPFQIVRDVLRNLKLFTFSTAVLSMWIGACSLCCFLKSTII
jgi:hypothetical protein